MSARRRYGHDSNRHYVRMAMIGAALIAVVTVIVFTKPSSLRGRFQVKAQVESANQLRPGAAVRLAGLDIGKVTAIEAGPDHTSLLRIDLDEGYVPHTDAQVDVKPRLILEGNAYVDLRLGSPSQPKVSDGATIPLERTSTPVQLDQVMSTFVTPVRSGFKDSSAAFAEGLNGGGAEALREAVQEFDRSLGSVERVSRAARGTGTGDLAAATAGSGAVTEQLAADPRALSDIMTSYATVSGALAARDEALGASARTFAALMADAPERLRRINAALPGLTQFARDLQPAIRVAPATLESTSRLLSQIDGIVRPAELPRALDALRPVTSTLPDLESQLAATAPRITGITDCLARTVLPAIKQVVPDGTHTTGDPVWLDLLHAGASLAAASPNFDGNGTTIRLGVTESEQAIQGQIPGIGQLEGSGTVRGMNPEWLGYAAKLVNRPDAPCSKQELPDFSARASAGPDWLTPTTRSEPRGSVLAKLQTDVRRLLGMQGWGDQRVPGDARTRPRDRPTQPHRPPATAPVTAPGATPAPQRPRDPVTNLVDGTVKPLVDQVLSATEPVTGPTHVKDLIDGILGGRR